VRWRIVLIAPQTDSSNCRSRVRGLKSCSRIRSLSGEIHLPSAVLCRAVLCCAVLCCAVLCCAVLCCAVLCCALLRVACIVEQGRAESAVSQPQPELSTIRELRSVSQWVRTIRCTPWHTKPQQAAPHYTTLHCTTLCCTTLFCTALHYSALHHGALLLQHKSFCLTDTAMYCTKSSATPTVISIVY
jgi:hypothetical protein